MTRDELWELLHKKMIDKLEEVLPIINEDSDRFIDLDWGDATGEFHDEWIRTMLVNIHSEQRMDEVIQLIASCYHRMYMNGERAAYHNNMPEYGVPKHQDIMSLMISCKKKEIARRKANQDDEDLKAQMHNKYKTAANEHNEKSSEINKQLEEENARLKKENAELNEKMNILKETSGFTCGQYAVLLYAVAQKLESSPIKKHLEKVFADITGFSPNVFHQKLMGDFSEKDKEYVASIIEDEMPHLAEAVRKL